MISMEQERAHQHGQHATATSAGLRMPQSCSCAGLAATSQAVCAAVRQRAPDLWDQLQARQRCCSGRQEPAAAASRHSHPSLASMQLTEHELARAAQRASVVSPCSRVCDGVGGVHGGVGWRDDGHQVPRVPHAAAAVPHLEAQVLLLNGLQQHRRRPAPRAEDLQGTARQAAAQRVGMTLHAHACTSSSTANQPTVTKPLSAPVVFAQSARLTLKKRASAKLGVDLG